MDHTPFSLGFDGDVWRSLLIDDVIPSFSTLSFTGEVQLDLIEDKLDLDSVALSMGVSEFDSLFDDMARFNPWLFDDMADFDSWLIEDGAKFDPIGDIVDFDPLFNDDDAEYDLLIDEDGDFD